MERILGSDGDPWSAAVEQGCSTLPDAEKQTQRGPETGWLAGGIISGDGWRPR